MTKGLSIDLRKRVVAYYEAHRSQGATYESTASRFAAGGATVNRWLRLKRETGSVAVKPPRHQSPLETLASDDGAARATGGFLHNALFRTRNGGQSGLSPARGRRGRGHCREPPAHPAHWHEPCAEGGWAPKYINIFFDVESKAQSPGAVSALRSSCRTRKARQSGLSPRRVIDDKIRGVVTCF
jgi:hypothetical protein